MPKRTIAPLPRAERRRLSTAGKKSKDPQTFIRFLVFAHLGAGKQQAEVARILDVAPSTVSRTVKRFLEGGAEALRDRRGNNGQRKVEDDFVSEMATLLERSPTSFRWQRPTWTRELLAIEMASRGFPRVSVCTIGRLLARLGARLGTPKPIVLCPWPRKRREAVLAELRQLEQSASAEEPVLFSDEVDIHLNPKVGRDWMLRGQQRRLRTPGKNQKFYLAGTLNAATGELICTGDVKKNSALFCSLLRKLDADFPEAHQIHLIVDNYCIHSSKLTERVLVELNNRVVLHFLPPYCPDANRIERVWQDLHANVTRNHTCRTMRELLDNAKRFLEAYRRGQPMPLLCAA